MSNGVTWWRVEFDEGEVRCTPVYSAATSADQRVWYVEASSEEAARAIATRMRARSRLRERRAQYRDQGLCRCGRERDSDLRKCRVCRERHAEDEKRRGERLGVSRSESKLFRGPVATPEQRVTPGPAQAQRRSGLRQTERLATLLEARNEFERTRKLGPDRDKQFLFWLIGQINKAKQVP